MEIKTNGKVHSSLGVPTSIVEVFLVVKSLQTIIYCFENVLRGLT